MAHNYPTQFPEEPEWVSIYPDTNAIVLDTVDLCTPTLMTSGVTATFRFYFNAPIDEGTIVHHNFVSSSTDDYTIFVKETSPRIDYEKWDVDDYNHAKYHYAPYEDDDFSNYEVIGVDENVLEFDMEIPHPCDPNKNVSMLPFQRFIVSVIGGPNGLRSIYGTEMKSNVTLTGTTLLPDVAWTLEALKVHDSNDGFLRWGNGEFKLTINGMTYEKGGLAALAADSITLPLFSHYSLGDGDVKTIDHQVLANRSITKGAYIDLAVTGVEDDDGGLADQLAAVSGEITNKLLDEVPVVGDLDLAPIIESVMRDLLDGGDEWMGTVEYHAGIHQWWGKSLRFVREHRKKTHRDIELKFKFELVY